MDIFLGKVGEVSRNFFLKFLGIEKLGNAGNISKILNTKANLP